MPHRLVNMTKLLKAPDEIRLFLRITYICSSVKYSFDSYFLKGFIALYENKRLLL